MLRRKLRLSWKVAADLPQNKLARAVDQFENKYDALNGADGLIVLTEWKQYRAPDFDEIKSRLKTPLIFDGRNLYNTKKVLEQGFTYYAIGKAIK